MTSTQPAPDLLTPAEAARMLGVTTVTLKRWASEGRINCVRTPGDHRRYSRAEITAIADLADGGPVSRVLVGPEEVQRRQRAARDRAWQDWLGRQAETMQIHAGSRRQKCSVHGLQPVITSDSGGRACILCAAAQAR